MVKEKISLCEPILTCDMLLEAMNALVNDRYVNGEYVRKFEKEFAKFVGSEYAVAVSSGTAALHLSLLAMGVGEGDYVVTTPATFIATANAIVHSGAKPIFVDISLDDYTLDTKKLEATIREYNGRIKAIIPVHLYGYPSNMDDILRLAEEYRIKVVEDACQAHGARYFGKKVGSLGDMGAFSFYPSKNMTVCGDGGMVVSDDLNLINIVKSLRDVGRNIDKSYIHQYIGYTARMNSFNAAIGLIQLKNLDEWNTSRRRIAKLYYKKLYGVGDLILPPIGDKNIYPVYHLYVIRTKFRDKLMKHLKSNNIECGIHYPLPVHLQPPYLKMGYACGMFPNAEQWSKEVLSIPMHPRLKLEHLNYIVDVIVDFFRRCNI